MTELSYNIDMFQFFTQYYDADEARKLPIGGGTEKCDICHVAFGASRKNKFIFKATGHGQSATFLPIAYYV